MPNSLFAAGFLDFKVGPIHSIGLKTNGSIVCFGNNDLGQLNVPLPNTDFKAVASGLGHSLGLKSDGYVIAWGANNFGQCTVPEPNGDFIAIYATDYGSCGIKRDGNVVMWGQIVASSGTHE